MKAIVLCIIFSLSGLLCFSQQVNADRRYEQYIPLLKGKNVALVCNHTSVADGVHLINVLDSNGINLSCVFTPEHGLDGLAQAGAFVGDSAIKVGEKNVKISSLYGNNKKPKKEQLEGTDIVLFDIQDVGCRFYTYISTLEYVICSCIENNIPLIVLDRPNPNNYIDGPVLKKEYRSFVGMEPVPVCYGLTIGEYANMINEEHWVDSLRKCCLTVIEMENYDREKEVELDIAPSPNLRTKQAIRNYPTLCFFEGTSLSVGRGTDSPFEKVGYKDKKAQMKWRQIAIDTNRIDVALIADVYRTYKGEKAFFNNFFDRLAGCSQFRKQIEEGRTAEEIRFSWQKDLEQYKKIRDKYLLY